MTIDEQTASGCAKAAGTELAGNITRRLIGIASVVGTGQGEWKRSTVQKEKVQYK
jgi:hypothetical protein